MTLSLIRKHDQQSIASRAEVADRFLSRLKGLIGKSSFDPGEGLLFPRCNSIHMWMMRIPIDVVFLRKRAAEWVIVSVHSGLKPWRPLPVSDSRADDVLELPEGTVHRFGLKSGEVLCIAS